MTSPEQQTASAAKTDSVPEKLPDTAPVKSWLSSAYSPSQLWQSRISWRITVLLFSTLVLVKLCVMTFTVRDYETEQLDGLRTTARAALIATIDNIRDQTISPLSTETATKLVSGTVVEGISVYGLDYSVIKTFGTPTLLQPALNKPIPASARSADGRHYDVIFTPDEIGHPYNVVLRLNASQVEDNTFRYARNTLLVFILMSAFSTSLLMIVFSRWLLEPIILLRNNLLSAAKNPEKPDLKRLKNEANDEIGIAIRIASDLIRQNANNLKRLHAQAEVKIHKLAYFDNLTGLPNRTYFLENLTTTIKHNILDEGDILAVMSVDLDHFKDINDTMGHEIGDKLLEAVGKRLVKALPEDALVARASADEFMIMALLKPDQPDSSSLAERIFTAMLEPINIMQENFQVRLSIGVAHYPEDGTEARQILKNADIALNRAKQEGRDTVRYYSQDFDLAVQQRFQILRDLRIAMDQKQLLLYYHPQFDLKTGALIGAEALLRWWRPNNSKEGGEFISPVEFIPVAEQSGLIVPIGEYVMKTACMTNKMWQTMGLPPLRMAVNISGVQFHRGDIVGQVASVLKETGLEPHLLELEVTESVFMENMQTAIDILNQLHRLGVELAVDDFGTGYSSLSYLRQFPIDRLKIDQSFIRNALVNPDDRMITKTIITLGHSLGLKVIAEGVETNDHENFLKEEGCDETQGFKYTKPLPADAFWDFAIAHNRALAKNSKLWVVE